MYFSLTRRELFSKVLSLACHSPYSAVTGLDALNHMTSSRQGGSHVTFVCLFTDFILWLSSNTRPRHQGKLRAVSPQCTCNKTL